ncbi:MAG TPA: 3-hydroxyacyl-CoA dehydrogenase family protein [Puia sp.]|nr:3-hydroxyacyl-CoA dehydrogenase family protein [Puia sp.]
MKVVLLTEKAPPILFPAADCVVVRTLDELVKHRPADLYVDLDFEPEETRIAALSRLLSVPVMVNAVSTTIAAIGQPFVRINGWPGMLERTVHELVVPDAGVAAQITRLYEASGRSFRAAPDIPGMVSGRILAVLINEAWYTWESGVSSKEEIDTAMRLGTNYPLGPFEWGERIGLDGVVELLEVMSRSDSRYRPAESLKKAAGSIKI